MQYNNISDLRSGTTFENSNIYTALEFCANLALIVQCFELHID